MMSVVLLSVVHLHCINVNHLLPRILTYEPRVEKQKQTSVILLWCRVFSFGSQSQRSGMHTEREI